MSSKSQQPKRGGYQHSGNRRVPKTAYTFKSPKLEFALQRSRVLGKMRPISSSAFVAGNFLYVYKNYLQLNDIPNPPSINIEPPTSSSIVPEAKGSNLNEITEPPNHPQESHQLIPANHQQNELNDVLFSHSIHRNSGAEFSLLFSVISHQPEDFICPICLYPPVAPRITHCGHIFCSDCISQHVSLSDQLTCPVCYKDLFEESNKDDVLKIIRTDLRYYPKISSIINNQESSAMHFLFQKVMRNRNNCVCFKCDEPNTRYIPTASNPSAPFCHFMLADKQYVDNLLEKEKLDLIKQIEIYKEYKDDLKISFLQETLNDLLVEIEQQSKLNTLDPELNPPFYLQESKPSEFYQFYQEVNGRFIFLDPISVRMLILQFNSINEAPNQLEVDALKVTTMSVDFSFRERHRSLGYLPTGADVTFVLADLSRIVSKAIYDKFAARIEKRLKVDDDIIYETEPEVEQFTEADFPDVFASHKKEDSHSQPVQQIKGEWANASLSLAANTTTKAKTLDEEFPSFGQVTAMKKMPKWGNPPLPKKDAQPGWGSLNLSKK